MSTIYDMLAPFYDELNAELDYAAWADFLEEAFGRREGGVREVLDLGCGTGSMTIELVRRGYDMVGIDLSPEMLSAAIDRTAKEVPDADIRFLLQDMRRFELYGTVQAAICTLDGINHLTSASDLDACLALLHNYIEPHGLFIFDVNSKYKFENIYGDRVYAMEGKDAFVVWQNDYNARRGVCDFYITLFCQASDGSYRRFDECQREKHYARTTLRRHLEKNGFHLLDVRGDGFGTVTPESERYYLIAERDGA